MTNDGWGSKWPVAPVAGWPKNDPENIPLEEYSGITPEMLGVKPDFTGWDKGTDDPWPRLMIHNGSIFKPQGSNLVDNEQYLYFQCDKCNEILDPHTKSFAKLQVHRASSGWKCVWNLTGMGYKVYCAKCGEKA